jgi:hypothetical protein
MSVLKLCQIERDTSRFQFRSVEFNPERVDWLVANWDAKRVDPLDVWQSSDRYFLLSGHHRYEAMLRLGLTEAECRIQTCSLHEAQALALVSNAARANYTDYEYCRCITFLIAQGTSLVDASNQMALSPRMARRYYTLRHLMATDWEWQNESMDLTTRAFVVGEFCDKNPLTLGELQQLFQLVVENDLSVTQLKQFMHDLKDRLDRPASDSGGLFNLLDFSSNVVATVKERDWLNQLAAQLWWIYCLVEKKPEVDIPAELREPFIKELKRLHAYAVGSDDVNLEPQRASTKGRKLRVNLDQRSA